MTMRYMLLPAVLVAAATCGSGVAAEAPRPPAVSSAAAVASDTDAAKHARRTACLKEAKLKKLVGAQKSAYLKECLALP